MLSISIFVNQELYSGVILFSLCRLIGMGNANAEKHQLEVPMEDDAVMESDDERPESFDNEARKKEMRKGIDLATTLERIEKNFVITDPRLPDNPIVSITFQQ